MSKLDELIAELCPDGVEYKTLDMVCSVCTGTQLNKNRLLDEGDFPVINGGINPSGYWHQYNTPANTIAIRQGGAAGYVSYIKVPFWAGAHCYIVKQKNKNINYKYLYYFLKNIEVNLKQCREGVTIPGLTKKAIYQNKIPIPPLEVQNEIVRILDNFTELTAELTAELTSRKKQFEYYRDKLLSSETSVKAYKKIKLSEISSYSKERIDASILKNDNYIGVDNLLQNKMGKKDSVHVPDSGSFTKYTKDDVLIGNIRPYLRKIWFASNSGGSNGDVLVVHNNNKKELRSRYLFHVLSSESFFDYNIANSRGAKMPRGNKQRIMEYQFSIPSLQVQDKIVDTLDNFEKICNDLNIGLPAEIDARQKQYEYYRDTLLSFAETDKLPQVDNERERERERVIKLVQYVFGYAPVLLSDIAVIEQGGSLQKKDFADEGVPCIHYGQIYTKYGIEINKTLTYINIENSSKGKIANHGDIVMAVTSENIEDVCSCLVWNGYEDAYVGGDTAIIKHNENSSYLAHYFHSSKFYKQKRKLAQGTKVIHVPTKKLNNVVINLPTLEEQNRIASILNKLYKLSNDMNDEIPAETKARKKQYEYYRDKLLIFKEKKSA